MQTKQIHPSEIIVGERQRTDLQDIDSLCESIENFGLIQPIIVNQKMELVAGGRRLHCIKELEWDNVTVGIIETATEDERAELELEENVRRADLTWQERVRAIAQIHRLRGMNAAKAKQEWGYRQTGELLNVPLSDVWYASRLASALDDDDEEIANAKGVTAAVQILCRRKANEAAKMWVSKRASVPKEDGTMEVVEQKSDAMQAQGHVEVFCGDAISWLAQQPDSSIECLYTDPPYAIDMDMLEQEGTGMDVSSVRDTHDVQENLQLLEGFLSLLPQKLKPTSFAAIWMDLEQWDFYARMAQRIGMRRQRWPITWVKAHPCMNQAARHNFTKSCEHAVLLAMPEAVLTLTRGTSHWTGPTDKADFGHPHPFWKPLGLHKWVLSGIAPQGCTIVDPFAGAGSIPLAAAQLGYSVRACELGQQHYMEMCKLLNV